MNLSDLLTKILCEDEITSEEGQAFKKALKSDSELERSFSGWSRFRAYLRSQAPSARAFVLHALATWGHAEDLSDEEAEEVSESWKDLDSIVESYPGFSTVSEQIVQDRKDFLACWEMAERQPVNLWSPWTYRVAAVVAVTVVCLISAVFLLNQRGPSLYTVSADPGEYERVLLPDGSLAHLNGPAMLQFNKEDFARTVEMTGKVFFDISTQQDQFIVKTNEAVTQVLGTRFGVRSLNGVSQVVLESGRIEVASKVENPQSVVLVPGQMTVVAKGVAPTPAVEVTIEDELGWTGFVFLRNTPLRKAALLLSSSRKVRIEVDSSLLNEPVTGTFAPDIPIEEALDALRLALNAEVLTEGEIFRIVP